MTTPRAGQAEGSFGHLAEALLSRPGATVSGAEIIEWSREQMANYKAPRAVELVDGLPLNAAGKVMKDVLRERATRGS